MNIANRNSKSQRSQEAGFTLVELLIVMSVILILMTLAIPKLMSTMKNANQTSAIASLRDIVSQENTYASSYPQHGFACTLAQLGGKAGTSAPGPDNAQLLPDDLAAGNKSGLHVQHHLRIEDDHQQCRPGKQLRDHGCAELGGPHRRPRLLRRRRWRNPL